jgi:gluconate 2-dehydrogenase gamma chain
MKAPPTSAPRDPSRRRLFKAAGAAGAMSAIPLHAAAQPAASAHTGAAYVFFNPSEAAFIEAAVARLIPSDDTGPGAIEAAVPNYIDKQLAGAWGAGERLYRAGPFHDGTPSQGYQLPYTPAELFRKALRGVDAGFTKMAPQEQDKYLDTLQKGGPELNGVPSKVFFESLLGLTIEGYLSDPAYGGNRDMGAWKMIGFPGAYADYYGLVDQYNVAFTNPPTSLAQDASGHVHLRVARRK